MTVPLIAIARHRLAVDGQGVTTLVAFHGCPLRCRYCLNAQCLRQDGIWKTVTPEDLLEMVMVDNLYFEATGGGITFGGGEPLLRANFIAAFCQLAKADERIRTPWHINIESSLNVPRKNLETVLPFINHFIVDIKDMNPSIYQEYTTKSQEQAISNLSFLAKRSDDASLLGKEQGRFLLTVRLPHIPNYNKPADVVASRLQLEQMGINDIEEFDYIMPQHDNP
jgi:pyruvate formate lyase activating enzyme